MGMCFLQSNVEGSTLQTQLAASSQQHTGLPAAEADSLQALSLPWLGPGFLLMLFYHKLLNLISARLLACRRRV